MDVEISGLDKEGPVADVEAGLRFYKMLSVCFRS